MSRYADQLPINNAPNGANFLLATNDSDGKALERIPLDLVGGGGGSTEYTILDETALDIDSNYALSAGLYLYIGNAPANFDLSGLADGERIEIINHTAHKVFLFGFTNWVWDGTTTALQTDNGLIVEKAGLIAVRHNGNLLLFNTLPNGLGQDWREGLAPPGFIYWRVDFTKILTEIQFYYEDAPNTKITLSGANVVAFARSASLSTATLQHNNGVLNDGLYSGYVGTTNPGYNTWLIQIPNHKNVSALHLGGQGGGYNRPESVKLFYSTDNINWNLVKEWINPSIADNVGSKLLV
jgi:hypothetical protein